MTDHQMGPLHIFHRTADINRRYILAAPGSGKTWHCTRYPHLFADGDPVCWPVFADIGKDWWRTLDRVERSARWRMANTILADHYDPHGRVILINTAELEPRHVLAVWLPPRDKHVANLALRKCDASQAGHPSDWDYIKRNRNRLVVYAAQHGLPIITSETLVVTRKDGYQL